MPGSSQVLTAAFRSLTLSLSVALLAGVAGLCLAWLVTRTDFPGRGRFQSLLAIPYAIPAYLLGMAWVVLGNPTVGLLKDFLPSAQGSYGFWGMTWVEASVAFAFPYLELRAGFERLDPALEEAARMSGARPWRVFKDVSFPLLWPSLLSGMSLAFLYTLAAFGVPALLGLPVRQFVLTTLIYSQFKLGGAEGLQQGLLLSLVLFALAVVVLGLSYWLSRLQWKRQGGAIGGGKSSKPSLVQLGRARWLVSAGVAAWFFLTVLLPWGALALSALAPVAGQYSPSLWTFKNLGYVLGLADFREALFNSLLLSVGVATAVVVGGFLLAYQAVRRRRHWAAVVIEALGVPFASPGTVIAVLLIFGSTWAAGFGIPLVDEALVLIAIAYAIKYAAVGAKSLVAAFHQVHPSLEEAARVSGASERELLWTIWVPLLKRNWQSAWMLAALPMATELTMSVLLTGPGASTLGTVLFQLQEYADQPSAAALAWMLLTLALAVGLLTQARDPARGPRGSKTLARPSSPQVKQPLESPVP